MRLSTNIERELNKRRAKDAPEGSILDQIQGILAENEDQRQDIHTRLRSRNSSNSNAFDLDQLETDRIYHIDTIKSICVDYRLRFLNAALFKSEFPEEAISKIRDLEETHNTALNGFKLMAPSKLFKLENADDPLLFAPIGNGYYYLIHKWGNDLSGLRKLLVWPVKNFDNMIFSIFVASILLTAISPMGVFTNKEVGMPEYVMLFLFMFKAVAAVVLYYGFAAGKNFNTAIWNSKYYNA
ncbi:hypothetical protein [Gilvibacter sediminis]|uniref:hypothetical protein n=1 Tax=Gilvibacter sediminis TaxID=379071 RepID=UPI00235095A6|nr:hypothetical protein [Gilvibacter sediminis]MDC7997892.1 hypothetical protein [Gilvibacter sediminis]